MDTNTTHFALKVHFFGFFYQPPFARLVKPDSMLRRCVSYLGSCRYERSNEVILVVMGFIFVFYLQVGSPSCLPCGTGTYQTGTASSVFLRSGIIAVV